MLGTCWGSVGEVVGKCLGKCLGKCWGVFGCVWECLGISRAAVVRFAERPRGVVYQLYPAGLAGWLNAKHNPGGKHGASKPA